MEDTQTDEYTEAVAPVTEETNDSVAQGEEVHVPLDALKAERAERQKLQEELRLIRDHLTIMQTQSSTKEKKDDFDDSSDDDVLTVGEFKKALKNKETQYEMTLSELRMVQKYPDYEQTITKYLPEVLKQNPSLRNSLQDRPDYELAYHLAKNSDAYKADHKRTKKNADAEKMIENAQRSGSLSAVGGTSPISTAKRYKTMTDEEFRKEAQKNLGYF